MLNTNNNTNNQSIIFKSMDLQQKLQDRRVFDQFLNKTQNQRVTCDKPRGYLVKENPVQMFGSMFVDTAKDVRNLGRAITKGESNDHELGRMNDLGMKLGGGLIAAALMGSKATTNKKLMELLGFGTFFSVMSLWPKVAIDLPTYLMHGFNPHQKYIDSQGRKKQFFQDNQYLPWDVWTKEDINKVADRMGVSKNMKDREEYTKEKMRTIALQGNTLWMLSAGLATPLFTSLICNRIENAIEVPTANRDLKSIANMINASKSQDTIDAVVSSDIFKGQDKEFKALTDRIRSGNITKDELVKKLQGLINITSMTNSDSKGYDLVKNALKDDTENVAKDMVERLFVPKGNSKGAFEITDRLVEFVTNNSKDKADIDKARELLKKASTIAFEKTGKNDVNLIMQIAASIARSDKDLKDLGWIQSNILAKDNKDFLTRLKNITEIGLFMDKSELSHCADTLDELYSKGIKPAQAQVRLFGEGLRKLDQVSGVKYNKVVETLIRQMNLSGSEINTIKHNADFYGTSIMDILKSHIGNIAENDESFDKTVKALLKSAEQIETVVDKSSRRKAAFAALTGQTSSDTDWGSLIKGIFDDSKKSGAKTKFTERFKTAREILKNKANNKTRSIETTFNALSEALNGGLKDTSKNVEGIFEGASGTKLAQNLASGFNGKALDQAMSNIDSVNGMINRMLSGLELEKRIKSTGDDSLINSWIKQVQESGYKGKFSVIDESNMEEFFDNCRRVVWNSTYGDAMNKFHFDGNGKEFESLLKAIFPDTSSIKEEVGKWNKRAREIASGCYSVPFPQLNKPVEDAITNSVDYNKFGQSLFDAVKNKADQLYNNRTWMKVFGGLAIATGAITLISQLFFGKVKNEHLYGKDTFEGGNTNVNK